MSIPEYVSLFLSEPALRKGGPNILLYTRMLMTCPVSWCLSLPLNRKALHTLLISVPQI